MIAKISIAILILLTFSTIFFAPERLHRWVCDDGWETPFVKNTYSESNVLKWRMDGKWYRRAIPPGVVCYREQIKR